LYFLSFQIKRQLSFVYKWLLAVILDVQNWFSFKFLAISIKTQLSFFQDGRWQSFWISKNHFRLHISPFQIKTQLSVFFKMATGSHFICPKFSFGCISCHSRSILDFTGRPKSLNKLKDHNNT
jgi:hypothetical protein